MRRTVFDVRHLALLWSISRHAGGEVITGLKARG